MDLSVTNSTVSYNGGDGIVCQNGVLTVTNSIVSNNTTLTGLAGILLGGSAMISGNVIDSNAQSGIGVTAGGRAVTVTNNAISNHPTAGIYSGGGSTGLGSNTFQGNGFDWFGPSIASMKNNVCHGSVC